VNGPGARQSAAVLHGIRDLRLETRARPTPGPREVVVQVLTVGVCGSDVHYFQHGRIGPYVVEAPLVLGHECAGVVAERGSEATAHPLGTRVALEPGVPCGACRECRSGHYNLCPDVRFFATPPVDGAFTEYVAIHEDFAFALPDSVSDEAAALIEPLSVGLWACRKAGVSAGHHVLITGAGPIGLLALQAAKAHGASQVTITDITDARLELARTLGATTTLNAERESLSDIPSADVLIECTGARDALLTGVASLAPRGVAVLVGMGPEETAEIPIATVQARELAVVGSFRYANTYPLAIDLIASGRIDPTRIIGARFPLDQVEQALTASERDPSIVKAMVTPPA